MAKDVKNRQPKDFNHLKPDQAEGLGRFDITDPDRAENEKAGIPANVEYPKHLHKAVGAGLAHEYVVVTDEAGEKQARRDGYGSAQEADAVNRAASSKADAAAPAAPAAKSRAKKAGK